MSDKDAIDAIIKLLEDTVALVQSYEPFAQAIPAVEDLMNQVRALKDGRGL